MSDEVPAFYYGRKIEHGATRWLVYLEEDGAQVGQVFKYIGYWWADTAGSLANRFMSKDAAGRAVVQRHLAAQGDKAAS